MSAAKRQRTTSFVSDVEQENPILMPESPFKVGEIYVATAYGIQLHQFVQVVGFTPKGLLRVQIHDKYCHKFTDDGRVFAGPVQDGVRTCSDSDYLFIDGQMYYLDSNLVYDRDMYYMDRLHY